MCKSRREGGQRCHAHALKAFEREQAECKKAAATGKAYVQASAGVRLEYAETDLASTEAGRDHLLKTVHGLLGTEKMVDAAMRGLARADKAEEWAGLSKAAKDARMSRDRTLTARKEQVRTTLENYRDTATSVAVGATTVGTNAALGTSPTFIAWYAGAASVSVTASAVWNHKKARHAVSRAEEQIHWAIGARVDGADPALIVRATAAVESSVDRVYSDKAELVEYVKERVRAEGERRLAIARRHPAHWHEEASGSR